MNSLRSGPGPRSQSGQQQVSRKISASLVGLQQQQQRKTNVKGNWVARVALSVCLLLVVVYLGTYLSALSSALNHAKETKSIPLTSKVVKKGLPNQNSNEGWVAISGTAVKSAAVAANSVRKAEKVLSSKQDSRQKETLVLTTKLGDIRIVLRPDLSKESVDYVRKVAETQSCQRCTFYRAEKPGILQGVLSSSKVQAAYVKGACPAGSESVVNDCPTWDKNCGCHGPVMTRGMVGWAAGQMGPDFFISDYFKPAQFWGTQHTVWGELQDETSLALLDTVWTLPAHDQGGLTMLDEPLHFEMSLE